MYQVRSFCIYIVLLVRKHDERYFKTKQKNLSGWFNTFSNTVIDSISICNLTEQVVIVLNAKLEKRLREL